MRRIFYLLTVIGLGISLYLVNVGLWASEVEDEDVFVEAAMESFTLDGSYEAIADILTDEIIERFPGAESVEVPLNALLESFVASPPFDPALEDLSRQVYTSSVLGERIPVTIDLAEYEDVILTAVAAVSPALAEQLPADLFTSYTVIDSPDIRVIDDDISASKSSGLVGAVLGVVLLVALVIAATTWTARLAGVGFALLIASGITIIAEGNVQDRFTVDVADERFAVLTSNLATVLAGGLTARLGIVLVVAGLLVVAAYVGGRIVERRQA